MAEVKKRGRPPKKKDELVELKNENTKEIKMEQQISIEQPYNRMREIFTRFNSKEFGYNDYLAAMGASFDNNPFIKNTRLKNINSPITITEKTKLDKAINKNLKVIDIQFLLREIRLMKIEKRSLPK